MSQPRLIETAKLFLRVGSTAFGGGDPTIAILQREFFRRDWLSRDQFAVAFGLARITPGTNVLAFCAAAGWYLLGVPGAVVAVLGDTVPASVLVIWLTRVCEFGSQYPMARAVVGAIVAAAVGTMIGAAITLVKQQCSRRSWLLRLNRHGSVRFVTRDWTFAASGHRNRNGGWILLGSRVNIIALYFLLLKATLTSFSGLGSLPMVRSDFVVRYHVLTDRELNTAVAAGRVGPGPVGIYVVSVGYLVAGVPGACAGWLAMITPAFLIIPMLRFLGQRAEHPRIKSMTRAVLLAGAGLMASAAVPLARDAISGLVTLGIVAASIVLLALTRISTLWVMLGAAIAGFVAFQF